MAEDDVLLLARQAVQAVGIAGDDEVKLRLFAVLAQPMDETVAALQRIRAELGVEALDPTPVPSSGRLIRGPSPEGASQAQALLDGQAEPSADVIADTVMLLGCNMSRQQGAL